MIRIMVFMFSWLKEFQVTSISQSNIVLSGVALQTLSFCANNDYRVSGNIVKVLKYVRSNLYLQGDLENLIHNFLRLLKTVLPIKSLHYKEEELIIDSCEVA